MPAFPTICSQLRSPSARKGNWERAVSRDPQHCWANWGHPFLPTEEICARGKLPVKRKRKSDLSHGGGHSDSFVLCPPSGERARIHLTSAIVTHGGDGEDLKWDRKKPWTPQSTSRGCWIWPRLCAELRGSTGDTQFGLRFLCRLTTDPVCVRGSDLQNSSGEKKKKNQKLKK